MFLSLNEVCEILGIISGNCTALDINAYLFISEYDLDSHLQASSYFDKRVYISDTTHTIELSTVFDAKVVVKYALVATAT